MATFGIDLGTTYSCIAYVDDSGRPVTVKSALGDDTTPSVVYFEAPTNVVVGRSAKDTAILHPDLVVSLIKRQMGQDVDFQFHGQRYTPESISALILKELAEVAGAERADPVRDVVITVPAYFGLRERDATRKAGEIAGLNVLDVVAEPVAAALHYESIAGDADRTILVYDLGGGTFDTTVIRLEGNAVRVVCTDGDHHLGGADWDDRIADHLLERFSAAHPDKDPSADEEFLQQLAIDAERLKKDLSSVQSRRPALRFDGAVEQVEFTRETFEELTSDLLERTMEITGRTVETARDRGADRFDEVLLVGGATKMPAVARELRRRFGFEPRLHDPDLAVAKGAARFALIESVKVRMPEEDGGAPISDRAADEVASQLGLTRREVEELAAKTVTTVSPRAFGVEVVDTADPALERTYVSHLLHANDPLPARVERERFYTVKPNQVAVDFPIWEQAGAVESRELRDNSRIGGGTISGLPPLPKDSPLEVTFDMDEMGTLRVHAVELSTGKDVHIELQIGGLDQDAIDEARALVARTHVAE
jgi:molecular chaperone DnaK (HSP70)